MSDWIDVCALDDIPQRGARIVRAAHGCVALFRTIDDAVFALDDRCPHKGGPLSDGIVHGRSVTCPLHNLVIDLEHGAASEAGMAAVRTHGAMIEEGRVLLHASALASRSAA